MANKTVHQMLASAGYSKKQRERMTLEQAVPILGVDPSILSTLRAIGFPSGTTLKDFFQQMYRTNQYDYSVEDIGQAVQQRAQALRVNLPSATSPQTPPPPPAPAPQPGPTRPPNGPQGGPVGRIVGDPRTELAPQPGPTRPPNGPQGGPVGRIVGDPRTELAPQPGPPGSPENPFAIRPQVVGGSPEDMNGTPISPEQWAGSALALGMSPEAVAQQSGLPLDRILQLQGQGGGMQKPPAVISPNPDVMFGQFPQDAPIAIPGGFGAGTVNLPSGPAMPSEVTVPPELSALLSTMQGTLEAEQTRRQQIMDALNAGISEQMANAKANQPLLDAALANINSVLTGQAMSPGLQGLIDSAFNPAEQEGQRKLRQAAEEAAAARGMSLTDSPIGTPYLEENRRFLEQMGGQRAQMGAQLREQDAAFSQRVREFQEGLRQQALSNQTEVLRSLGTPEQAASVLGNLGLGARNAATQEFGIRTNAALGQADQQLRAALGQAGINQQAQQLALAAQQQGFQQQFSKQQAGIQNQMALMGALGDPFGAYSSWSGTGTNLANLGQMNSLQLIAALAGNPVSFNPASTTTSTSIGWAPALAGLTRGLSQIGQMWSQGGAAGG